MHDNMGMVRKHLLRHAHWSALLCAAGFFFVASSLFGQKTLLEKTGSFVQDTDINVNLYGAFPMTATGAVPQESGQPASGFTALKQTADPSAGFRFGVRHVFNPLFGLEFNAGYNRATQNFTGATPHQNGEVYSHAKPITLDYVLSMQHLYHGFQPFVLVGAGLISYNISSTGIFAARAQKIPVGEYGIGADYHPGAFPQFMAMRFQFRGLVGHAPDYRLPILSTNNVVNISEPQVGLVFKF